MEIRNSSKRNSLEEEAKPLKDSLLGLTALNQDIVLLHYGYVVIRRGYRDFDKVRLLSGGIAGTDLYHAIMVGKGMLTAAILGDETGPSSREILRTIEELTSGENYGILVIAQANSELFNFALAAERANADCRRRVELLSIDDDKSSGAVKERNSCGIILLTKILGAMAENGASFGDICQCYKDVIDHIFTVPLNYHDEETGRNKRKSVRLSMNFEVTVRYIIDEHSRSKIGLHPSIPTVALINTSKNLTRLEELGFVKQVADRLRQLGVCAVRLYLGNFVTAAPGRASLTVMNISDKKIVEYLDAPCEAVGWQRVVQFLPEVTVNNEIPGALTSRGKQQETSKGPKLSSEQAKVLLRSVQFACDALISCERQLNIIDAERSEGNVGTRLTTMAQCVNKRVSEKKMPLLCPSAFFKKLAVITESAVGGTMGSIYGILFESVGGFFGDLPEDEPITPLAWAKALTVAANSMKKYCNEKMQLQTMYYPIKACEVAVKTEMSKDQHFIECFGSGVSRAEEAAEKTQSRFYKYADAGAHAVGIWMRAVFEGVKLSCLNSINNEK